MGARQSLSASLKRGCLLGQGNLTSAALLTQGESQACAWSLRELIQCRIKLVRTLYSLIYLVLLPQSAIIWGEKK